MNATPTVEFLHSIRHSPVRNYILPGLTSYLISKSEQATVRLFSMAREQDHRIVPHSHRFDFQCIVLRGYVNNAIYSKRGEYGFDEDDCDLFEATAIKFNAMGEYERIAAQRIECSVISRRYGEGDWYGMTHDQIHAIEFSRNAEVLFIEGPNLRETSEVLEPVVDDVAVRTFKTEPWMFKHDSEITP